MDPWTTLRDEYYILQEELMQNDSPIHRRNFIRAVCSNVEGTLNYIMAQLVKSASLLSPSMQLAFSEKQVKVKQNGDVEVVRLTIKTQTKIKMVFKFLDKHLGGSRLDLSNNDFNKLNEAFKVRDRLMHPRNDNDLVVTKEEVQMMIDGYKWYITGYQSTMKFIAKELTA
ncbi:MAG: hypothetical protein QM500_01450 [Methylococcales bacterium]